MTATTALLLGLILGLVLGVLAGALLARSAERARNARALADADLLRRRVAELEDDRAASTELAATLGPLSQTLSRVERQVGVLERDRTEQYTRLDAQLRQVSAEGSALRAETAGLAGALRSSTARGSWGEVQLRRVVEVAGMVPHVDFDTQVVATAPDGTGVRPDLVVHLPGGKSVVVDAKAPLAALLPADGRADGPGPEQLAAHARALQAHVDTLAGKKYWAAFSPAPEFVVCFLPSEALLGRALEADPGLLDRAMARRVIPATPATLVALLRTVALTWQQDALAGSAREVFDLGRELYARLAHLGEGVGKLGRTLDRAVEDYNRLVGTLERRVMVTARHMEDLDITSVSVAPVEPLDSATRHLTAPEFLDTERGDARRAG